MTILDLDMAEMEKRLLIHADDLRKRAQRARHAGDEKEAANLEKQYQAMISYGRSIL